MHLKHIRDFTTSIPRSLGEGITLPEGFVFSDATPSPSLLINGSGNTPLQITSGTESQMYTGNGAPVVTTISNYSQISPADPTNGNHLLFGAPGAEDGQGGSSSGGGGNGSRGGGLVNPLHGLGLDVEQYPSLLQNLLGMSGDALDSMEFDPSLLGDSMLGGPGDTMLSSFGGPSAMTMGNNTDPTGAKLPGGETPSGSGSLSGNGVQKRQRDDEIDQSRKRSRFEVVE